MRDRKLSPWRRRSLAHEYNVDINGKDLEVRSQVGLTDDGRVGELFIDTLPANSDRNTTLGMICILISKNMEHGTSPEDVRLCLGRIDGGLIQDVVNKALVWAQEVDEGAGS